MEDLNGLNNGAREQPGGVSRPEQMRERTQAFALRILRLFQALPRTDEARILGRQALRSGTSVAANYRAACRARSKAEFIARMGVVVEEADETVFWLELLVKGKIVSESQLSDLQREAQELCAISSASLRTAKRNPPPKAPVGRARITSAPADGASVPSSGEPTP
jgi:four helix bundle protein